VLVRRRRIHGNRPSAPADISVARCRHVTSAKRQLGAAAARRYGTRRVRFVECDLACLPRRFAPIKFSFTAENEICDNFEPDSAATELTRSCKQ
jgi:hypothetical protein